MHIYILEEVLETMLTTLAASQNKGSFNKNNVVFYFSYVSDVFLQSIFKL